MTLALQNPASAPEPVERAVANLPAKIRPITFEIPSTDLEEFWTLARGRQQTALCLLRAMRRIHAAPAKERAARQLSHELAHIEGGASVKTLLNKYRLYIRGGWKSGRRIPGNHYAPGDWRSLIPDTWLPAPGWPADFVAYFRAQVERNQRKSAPAIRELKLRTWPSGQAIPGYGTWQDLFRERFPERPLPPKCPPDFFPASWSDRNLYRLLPDQATLALARQGISAAQDYLPTVGFDTSGLRPMEIIFIDDFWADFKVAYERGIDYCMGLAALDWATRCYMHWGLMPRAKMPDGKRKSLEAADMQWFVVELLRKTGLPDGYPVTLYVENNTASISAEFEERIRLTFAGRVLVKRSGLLNQAKIEAGFPETGGKWRDKAAIESGFNLFHNELGAIAGQKGSNERLNGPGHLAAAERYAVKLLQDKRLTPETIRELRLPFISFEDAMTAVGEAFDRIVRRTDHRLKGLDLVKEWRLSEADNWIPYGAPATEEQYALIEGGAEIIQRTRRESPVERFEKLAREITWQPIPEHVFVPLSAASHKHTVRAKGEITIERKGRKYTFIARDAATAELLTPGREYRCYLFGDDPAAVHLTALDSLEHIASVPRFGDIDPRDQEARAEAYAVTKSIANRTLGEYRERHADEAQAHREMRAHNDAILSGASDFGRQIAEGETAARKITTREIAAETARKKRTRAEQAAYARQLREQAEAEF